MRSYVRIGADVDVIRESPDGVELFGRVRLRPGFPIEILPSVANAPSARRLAIVWSWRIRCLGSGGPIFRGECRWCPSVPIGAGRPDESGAGNTGVPPIAGLARDLMNTSRRGGATR